MPSCIQTVFGTRTSSMASNYQSRYRPSSEKCASDSERSHLRSSQDFLTIKRGASRFQIYAPRDPKNTRHGHVYSLTTPTPRKQCPRSSATALKKVNKIAQLSSSDAFYSSPPSVDKKYQLSTVSPPKYALLPRPPRTSNSVTGGDNSDKQSCLKPAGKSSSTDGRFHQSHVSFTHPNRPIVVQMHPLLACSRVSRSPISYDIVCSPSSKTIVDRITNSPIPAYLLLQPATEPATTGKMKLKIEGIPWDVVVAPTSVRGTVTPALAGHRRRMAQPPEPAITNLDLLFAIHQTMYTAVTREEWEALGNGSSSQRKVAKAYEKRCLTAGTGWEEGVRRIDYLKGRTKLVGIEVLSGIGGGTKRIVFKA